MKRNNKKIIFTGGHAGTAALSLIQEIRKQNLNWEIHWIGPKKAIDGKNTFSLEYKYFKQANIKFHAIEFAKLHRRFSIWAIISFLKIPLGFIKAFLILVSVKPSLVFSFGGFAAFPVVVISKLLGIPVFLHEQTSVAGRSNIYSAKFADEILLARETSIKYFPKEKTFVVGNPILVSEFKKHSSEKNKSKKTILIMGGSRGSQIINNFLKKSLTLFLDKYKLIHITGDLDFKIFNEIKNNLSKEEAINYSIYSSLDPFDMAKIYSKTDLAISRAGANTVSELIALGIPSIFIPIPWAYQNEQYKNAEHAKKYINAIILDQNTLSSNEIIISIDRILNNLDSKKIGDNFDKEASKKIVNLLVKFVK